MLGTLRVILDVKQSQNNTIFSCCIQNIGNTAIGLYNTFLFLDEGVFNPHNNLYEFPFLQKKYLGIEGVADEDCIGCAHCRKGDSTYPMQYPHIKQFYDEFRFEPFCQCYPLHHLSSNSILYMAPNESFTEELVVKLNKGVYRAILMCVPTPESCDCMCCNKCFVVG